MKDVIVIISLLGQMTVTSYRSVPRQTDDSPFITSTGEHVHAQGCAVSQDLLRSGRIKYGDWIYVEGIGLKVVNDTTNSRLKCWVDVWVRNEAGEKRVGIRKQQNIFKVEFKETQQ